MSKESSYVPDRCINFMGLCAPAAVFLAVIVLVTGSAVGKPVKEGTPITTKLKMSRVLLSVSADPEFIKRLTDRALARLKKSGLTPAASDADGDAFLILTLKMRAIEGCAGKIMYINHLELVEEVSVARNPDLRVEATTWFLGPGLPSIRERLSIEQLERDVDWYIDRFIVLYKSGND